MEILSTQLLHKAEKNGRCFLALHEHKIQFKDRVSSYFFVTRGETVVPPGQKKPDAVVIVPIWTAKGEEPCLILCSEFRPAVGCRIIGFPAGLIDQKDFDKSHGSNEVAAVLAAERELNEETGLEVLAHFDVPSPALYVSAGMTNESVMYVFCQVTGDITSANLEDSEDINAFKFTHAQVSELLYNADKVKAVFGEDAEWSKTAWPIVWALGLAGWKMTTNPQGIETVVIGNAAAAKVKD